MDVSQYPRLWVCAQRQWVSNNIFQWIQAFERSQSRRTASLLNLSHIFQLNLKDCQN